MKEAVVWYILADNNEHLIRLCFCAPATYGGQLL